MTTELFLATIVALLPIANPVSTAALFLGITQGDTEAHRRHQATMGVLYMFGILVVFLVAGSLILEFFGISLSGLRIAGGIMVAKVAWGMLNPGPDDNRVAGDSKSEARKKSDVSFTPLAMPSLSGPGAIAVTIGLAAEVDAVGDYLMIALGILAVSLISWVALRGSTTVVRFFGVAGMNALSRIMGFLLLCVGVQFVLNGMMGFLSNPEILRPVIEAVTAAYQPS